jgi:hypothetical protein
VFILGEHRLLPLTTWIRDGPFRNAPSLFYRVPKDWRSRPSRGSFRLGADSAPPVLAYLHWAKQWTHNAGVGFNHLSELVFQGSIMAILPVRCDDRNLASAKLLAYEFQGKPGDPARVPPQIAPYHLRLDWLMWFVHKVQKLLEGDAPALSLLHSNPFQDPEEHKSTSRWWDRQFSAGYFPVVGLDNSEFRGVLRGQGWL